MSANILKHDLGLIVQDSLNVVKLRKTTLTTCTGLFSNSYGLPCIIEVEHQGLDHNSNQLFKNVVH